MGQIWDRWLGPKPFFTVNVLLLDQSNFSRLNILYSTYVSGVVHNAFFRFPGASVSASNVVTLKLTDQVDLAEINSAQDCIAAAAEPEVVSLFEEVVNHWCKQVAQVPVS